MPSIHDEEFGTIHIRKHVRSSSLRIKVAPDGTLQATVPMYTPLIMAKRMIRMSRNQIREMVEHRDAQTLKLYDGMQIGKSHTLVTVPANQTSVSRRGQQIVVQLRAGETLETPTVIDIVKPIVLKALRREASSYLPRRLEYLAVQQDASYAKVRFSHAGTRWGSCSSNGTISLNIMLMMLPFELVEYVLVHELAHTKEMNHSSHFWAIVERALPNYKQLRKELKAYSPII